PPLQGWSLTTRCKTGSHGRRGIHFIQKKVWALAQMAAPTRWLRRNHNNANMEAFMRSKLLSALLVAFLGIGLAPGALANETLLEDVDSFYPRLVRLQSSGAADGRLIASFDVIGAGHIYQSTDDGVN